MNPQQEISDIIQWYYNLPGDYNLIMVLHEKSRKLAALLAFYLKDLNDNNRMASNAEIKYDTNQDRIERDNHSEGVMKAKTIAKLQTEGDLIHKADCKLLKEESANFLKQANRVHDDIRSWITTLRAEKFKTNYDYDSDKQESRQD